MIIDLENSSPPCVPCIDSVAWAKQTGHWIVEMIAPGTVLVVGGNYSILAESLCDLGVQAHHIAAPEIEPTLQQYDFVVAIDVPMPDACVDIGQAIANISAYSDDVLFAICALAEGAVNALSPAAWTVSFQKEGFIRDLTFAAPSLFPWAARFRRTALSTDALLAYYERHLYRLERESRIRRSINLEEHRALVRTEGELRATQALVEALRDNIKAWEMRWADLERGILWPWVQRLQNLRAQLMPPGSRRERWLERLFAKAAK